MSDYEPCVCHKGITWDTDSLTYEGHCPLFFAEQNNSEYAELQERQAAYDEEWS